MKQESVDDLIACIEQLTKAIQGLQLAIQNEEKIYSMKTSNEEPAPQFEHSVKHNTQLKRERSVLPLTTKVSSPWVDRTFGYEERFYKHYPRKQGKKDGLKAWMKLTEEQRLKAIEDVVLKKRATRDPQWVKKTAADGTCVIPLPATYLRGEKWEDEIVSSDPSTMTLEERAQQMADKWGMTYEESLAALQRQEAANGRVQ